MAVANARLQQLINKTTGRKVVVHYDKILGKGGYGIVYQATLDGDEVAAKELQFEFAMKVDVSKFIEECLLLNEVSSKPCHIVHFHGVYKSPPSALGQAPRLFIIMERMESSLYEFESYGQVSRDSVVEILRNVADGLQTLHSSNLIHRDLTPGNVLLKTDPRTRRIEAKISDLGVARRLLGNESKLTACPGTYSFMPPEAFHCPTVYNEKLDIYSFGLLMVYLLCGKLPNSHDAPFGARKLLSRAFMKHVGAHLFRLIERCLAKDPDLRPTAEDVLEYFNNRKTFKPSWQSTRQPGLYIKGLCTNQECIADGEVVYFIGFEHFDLGTQSPQLKCSECSNHIIPEEFFFSKCTGNYKGRIWHSYSKPLEKVSKYDVKSESEISIHRESGNWSKLVVQAEPF